MFGLERTKGAHSRPCNLDLELVARKWANAIRSWAPSAHGFVWRAHRDEDRLAYVFFGDRVPAGALTGAIKMDADSGTGLILVRAVLQKHNVSL